MKRLIRTGTDVDINWEGERIGLQLYLEDDNKYCWYFEDGDRACDHDFDTLDEAINPSCNGAFGVCFIDLKINGLNESSRCETKR
jgi:hypothetical protein